MRKKQSSPPAAAPGTLQMHLFHKRRQIPACSTSEAERGFKTEMLRFLGTKIKLRGNKIQCLFGRQVVELIPIPQVSGYVQPLNRFIV